MKILHIITRLIIGGAQENTLLTCEGLHRRGHDVTLLTGPSEGPEGSLLPRAQAAGYRVIVTPHLVRNPSPSNDLAAYKYIRQLCREEKFDVVHTHSSKAGIIGRFAAWKEHVPIVIHTIHGLPFFPHQHALINTAWIMLERRAAKKCHRIICVANAMARQALRAKVGYAKLYTTIYSGMDVEPFIHPRESRQAVRQRLGIPEDHLVLGTIARLQPMKGHDDLLTYAKQIFKAVPKAHFLWIGNGIFRERFEALIKKNNWEKNFTLTGLVQPEEVPHLLPAMDILVHPSYREGLARAIPQALLAGIPVISYDCDGASEVCLHEKTGLLVPLAQPRDLAGAIIQLSQNPAQREEMGTAGRALCLQWFSADTMVTQIERVYTMLQNPAPTLAPV